MSLAEADALSLSNLGREEIRANPYPFYEQLRAQDPIHWDAHLGFWALSKYADIDALYTDERFSRAQGLMRGFERLPAEQQPIAQPVYHSFSKTVFYADPPYHTRLRGLINHAFTPRRIEQLRPYVQNIVDELLDDAQGRGGIEIVRDLAYPLPVMVIAELLGLPASDRARFKQWSDDLFAILGTVRHKSRALLERAAHSLEEMTDYVRSLSRIRRDEPQDDLLSALILSTDDDLSAALPPGHPPLPTGELTRPREATAALTETELVANVNILLSTGHETTTHLIGNGILALLQHPTQLRRLKDDPGLLPSAIEEILRYDNPVQITYRAALEDVELHGRLIRKGDLVNTIIGSANRDPERFTDPDTFDITRNEGRHLSFGLGIHYCIGAPLVKMEAEVAFATLLRRFPKLQLQSESLEWQEQPIFRGLKELKVGV